MTAASHRIDTDTLRRGACPSLAAPMQTGDGLLVRLRPVAPALTANDLLALAGLARETGNGLIEITARGNIQLRGLTGASVPRLAQGLAAAGIVPQTGVAIETPALSGIDPSEIADATPMADALRAAIAAAGLTLAPKLAIVVDGGGVLSLADMVADIRLDAIEANEGVVWRLAVGGDRETARSVGVLAAESAVDGTMAVVAALAAIGPAARGRDLDVPALAADLPFSPVGRRWPEGSDEGACSPVGVCAPPSSRCRDLLPGGEQEAKSWFKSGLRHPIGKHNIGGHPVLGVAPAYGQVHADRLAALIQSLSACGATEFRLAPHRTLLVRGLSEEGLVAAQGAAEREGFWCTDQAPGRSVSICAGAAGCASASFDTHAAADAVVAHAAGLLDGSVDVHISGCPKGCAHPARAAVTLCGTAGGVGLVMNGKASDPALATVPAEGFMPAIRRLGALLRNRRAESETAKTLLDRTAPDTIVSAYQGHP
ncbi:precorrin-3B synthase [Shinella sp. AETb1-6]|uniref:precorrin-3B synthase n=1 Tax=Shinella sp. AETb1-6 TaxID=2692210 RepID=UPI0013696E9F|nr:precorrin-3B synthase [Shinella sp. AETb1-6]MXN52680.1 precorrin-3B synthase [Shinella sp. AETb1-6]